METQGDDKLPVEAEGRTVERWWAPCHQRCANRRGRFPCRKRCGGKLKHRLGTGSLLAPRFSALVHPARELLRAAANTSQQWLDQGLYPVRSTQGKSSLDDFKKLPWIKGQF